jgi:hypothetical protein
MSDFIKSDGLMDGKGESDTEWITLPNGVHIPVKDGESKEDAINDFAEADEFRHITNKKIDKEQHPVHIYAKSEAEAKFLSLTTSPKDIGETKDAIPLRHNPNPQDTRTSYFIPKSKTEKIRDLGQVLKKWKLNRNDNKKMKPYRDEPFNT